MGVTFFNVDQGDCTLVRLDEFSALFDGGRRSKLSQQHINAMRRRTKNLGLLVGTHYDADHLGGLLQVVHAYRDEIRLALVPPVIDDFGLRARRIVRGGRLSGAEDGFDVVDNGNAGLPFLAHRLTKGFGPALTEYDHALEPFVFLLKSLTGHLDDGLPSGRWDSEELLDLPEDEPQESPFTEEHNQKRRLGKLSEAAPNLERDLDVFRIAALRHALRKLKSAEQLPNARDLIEVALKMAMRGSPSRNAWMPSRWDSGIHSAPLTIQRIVRILKQEGNRTITACWLDDLVQALESYGIHWDVALAPDQCQWVLGPIEICQLEPTTALLKRHEHRIPVETHLERLSRVQSTPANQLSYVFALRGKRGQGKQDRPGVLITGDSGFRDDPSGCETIVAACSLVHVPHHGGSWGKFHTRLITARKGKSGPLSLWTTVDPEGCSPPTQSQSELRKEIGVFSTPYSTGRNVISYFNNNPEPECVGCSERLPLFPVGPPWVDFVESHGSWEPKTSGVKRCTCP